MKTLQAIYMLAGDIDKSWCENECIDWSEAEQLIAQVKTIPNEWLIKMKKLIEIVAYTEVQADWDSGLVALWPVIIRSEIEEYDNGYQYKQIGNNWKVYSQALTGKQIWKATVESEHIAIGLINFLSQLGTKQEHPTV